MTDAKDDFDQAVHDHAGRLFGLAFAILGDSYEAEDAVQASMERAWHSWGSLQDPLKRGAWLRTICVRECVRTRRVLRRRATDSLHREMMAPASTPAHDQAMDAAFCNLSAKQRAVVALHYHYGFSLDECADLMGCRPGTARSHLSRALSSMRKDLSDG